MQIQENDAIWLATSYKINSKTINIFQFRTPLPQQVRLITHCDEDTSILEINDSVWDITYLGCHYYIDWNKAFFETFDFELLIKHFLCYRFQALSPSTVFRDFTFFTRFNLNYESFNLQGLLSIYKKLFFANDSSLVYTYLQFYRWGIRKGISIFNYEFLLVLESLPKIERNPFESIALNENYVTSEEEAELLDYIKLKVDAINNRMKSTPEYSLELYEELIHPTLLLLCYETAPRPAQVHLLNYDDFNKIESKNKNYYSIRYAMIKQGTANTQYTTNRSLSEKLGKLLDTVIEFNQFFIKDYKPKSPLFVDLSKISRYGTDQLRDRIESGHYVSYNFTFSSYRHHLAQSLVDQGASKEIIADRMGHTDYQTAKAYITATPNIATIMNEALGTVKRYPIIMNQLLTGEIIDNSESVPQSKLINGTVGGATTMTYIEGIGACDNSNQCPYHPIYSCYACKKFHPFIDGPHEQVLDSLRKEVIEFSNSSLEVRHAGPMKQLEPTIQNVKRTIDNIEEYKNA
ncbi:MAG: site-specific integrase [Lentisphaerales bacterium]|nr:site-specific integrase [Lentisphaerales bacterium]